MTLRIAMLYTPLIAAGGGERQFLEELRHLRALRHDVQGLTFSLHERALFVAGVTRHDVNLLHARGGWVTQIASLRAALARTSPDVLVSHTSPELTWLATRASRTPYILYHNSPPFYIGAHANPYMASRRYRAAFPAVRDDAAGYAPFLDAPVLPAPRQLMVEARTLLKHHALRGARAVVVPSQRTRRELQLLHGVDAAVVRGCLPASLLPGGPPPRAEIVPAEQRPPHVLSVCRLEPVKRIDLLLRAFASVRRSVPGATLTVAGTGSDEARLRALTNELSLSGAVTFAGYVPESQLWSLFASARVLAAPAMADFIIAPYEAMAMGARVVWTTEVEADPAIAASDQVFVAPPEERAFAAAIVRALRAGGGRRADLRSMTWEARARRIETVIAQSVPEAAA
jgi:glycosyltransferase involved in cell wall biosynthesis